MNAKLTKFSFAVLVLHLSLFPAHAQRAILELEYGTPPDFGFVKAWGQWICSLHFYRFEISCFDRDGRTGLAASVREMISEDPEVEVRIFDYEILDDGGVAILADVSDPRTTPPRRESLLLEVDSSGLPGRLLKLELEAKKIGGHRWGELLVGGVDHQGELLNSVGAAGELESAGLPFKAPADSGAPVEPLSFVFSKEYRERSSAAQSFSKGIAVDAAGNTFFCGHSKTMGFVSASGRYAEFPVPTQPGRMGGMMALRPRREGALALVLSEPEADPQHPAQRPPPHVEMAVYAIDPDGGARLLPTSGVEFIAGELEDGSLVVMKSVVPKDVVRWRYRVFLLHPAAQ